MNNTPASTDILNFWFSSTMEPHWFNSTLAIDEELKKRFEPLYLQARNHQLSAWEDTAEGLLALIILFDQIPLNIYRGLADSFATESRAIVLSKQLINLEKMASLASFTKAQQLFALLPLCHSEDIQDQDLLLSTAQALGWQDEDTEWFKHHRAIVEKYGRFPHRNAILGRQSSAEELHYLASDAAFTG